MIPPVIPFFQNCGQLFTFILLMTRIMHRAIIFRDNLSGDDFQSVFMILVIVIQQLRKKNL